MSKGLKKEEPVLNLDPNYQAFINTMYDRLQQAQVRAVLASNMI